MTDYEAWLEQVLVVVVRSNCCTYLCTESRV